jgi:hypothetical protein
MIRELVPLGSADPFPASRRRESFWDREFDV